ncbi:COG4223 family protein [Rhodobacter capsulatus]|uniref:COG4223 family protein n=1 Tax=Rhodobacter capsulatus TaxID=1061 RepID=UPI00402503AB
MANPDETERDSTAEIAAQTPEMSDKDAGSPGADVTEAKTEAAAPAAAAPVSKPASESAPAKPKPVQQPPRGGMSVVWGGIIAAVIGSVGTLVVLPKLPPELRDKVLPGAQSEVEKTLADQTARLDGVIKAMAELQAGNAGVAALQTAVGDLTSKVQTLEAQGGTAPAAPVDLSGVQGQIDALKAMVEKSPAFASQQQLEAATAAAKAQIAAAEAETAKIRAESEAAAKKAIAQAAVARVAAAFETDAPIDGALGDVAAAGVSVPDALKGALPSIAAIKAAFPEAARKALTTARKATAGDTVTDKLGSFLLAQTGARSLTAKDGTGPDAVLSRAQTAVDAAQFDAALTEIGTLPEAAQADLQSWKDMVAQRASAQAAIADLTQSVQ